MISNNIRQLFEQLNNMEYENTSDDIIKIRIIVTSDIDEEYRLPSGIKGDIYDDATLDGWYDFVTNIEGIIDSLCDIRNISSSNNKNSLSEYIDFYCYDSDGNLKTYLVDMRISDHPSTLNDKNIRRKRASKIDSKFHVESITVNDHTFTSYNSAEKYIRELIAKLSFTNEII